MNLSDLGPGAWCGVALLVAYWVWIWAFFARVRPRLMAALGRRLRVELAESHDLLDAGTYGIEKGRASPAKHGAVALVDLVVSLVGVVGVAALVFVPAFIVAESGVLLPLEGRLTGRSIAVAPVEPVNWTAGSRRAEVALDVRNDGRTALRQCSARTADYTARNGYLHGQTATFDLDVGVSLRSTLALEASRPPVGEHRVRIKVECANERLAAAEALVVVR